MSVGKIYIGELPLSGLMELDAQTILARLKTVDGPNSGLDSDYIGGISYADIASGWFTSGETWAYSGTDTPVKTYTFTITGQVALAKYSAGMRVRFKQGSIYQYGIITKVAGVSTNTEVTIYCGTDYSLVDATITDNAFSMWKAPVGFPLNPLKWTVSSSDTTNQSVSTPNNTWKRAGTLALTVPIGAWDLSLKGSAAINTTATAIGLYYTLSSNATAETNSEFTNMISHTTGYSATQVLYCDLFTRNYVNVTAATPFYPLLKTDSTTSALSMGGNYAPTIIRATCAYL